MKRGPGLAIMLAAAVVLVGCERAATPPLAGSVVEYFESERTVRDVGLTIAVTVSPGFAADELAVADVTGDAAEEVVVFGANQAALYTVGGERVAQIEVAEPRAHLGFVADVDGDGKADLVLGSSGDSTSRVRVVNAQGELIAEGVHGSLVDGRTVPRFLRDGAIYFTAGSALGATPRVTGRFIPERRSTEWLRRDGMLPDGLVYSSETDTMGVANRGTGRDLPGTRSASQTPADRSAVLLVDPAGGTVLFRPVGAALVDGTGGPGQVSQVQTIPVVVEGEPGALVVASRESGLYEGSSEVWLVDETGEALFTYEGPPATGASVAVAGGAAERTFAVLWSDAGRLDILDERLSPRAIHELPGRWHHARLHAASDVDGDGAADFLVSDMGSLSIVSAARGAIARIRMPTPVRAARFASAEGVPVVVALATDLHVLELAPGDPPPVADTLAEAGPPSGPTMSVRASTPVAWTHAVPLVERPIPGSLAFSGVHDMAGDATPEIVVVSAERSRLVLLDGGLRTLGDHPLPERFAPVRVPGDVDGDGKADLVGVTGDPVPAAVVVSGSGRTLLRTPLSHTTSTVFTPAAASAGKLWLGVVTGHMLQPRGVYQIDAMTAGVDFFYRIAGFPNVIVPHDGLVLVSNYTPNNGGVVLRPDGVTDRDSAMFVHAVRTDGTVPDWTRPVDIEAERGQLQFFEMDGDGDGSPEAFAVIRRDEVYNPGPSGVYRVGTDGLLEAVVRGPDNGAPTPHVRRVAGREVLVVSYRGDRVVAYGPDLEPRSEWDLRSARFVDARDLDGDDELDLVSVRDGALVFTRSGGRAEVVVVWPDRDMRFARPIVAPDAPMRYVVSAGDRYGVVEAGR